jgi:hypothetical protein
VRVLHAHYGPGEKSVIHSDSDSAAVMLRAAAHQPEDIGPGPVALILVELKKPAGKK